MQLSGLIVEKSLRKKDVKDKRTTKKQLENNNSEDTYSIEENFGSGDKVYIEEKSQALKNKQEQINLISVDAQRISDFLSYNGM